MSVSLFNKKGYDKEEPDSKTVILTLGEFELFNSANHQITFNVLSIKVNQGYMCLLYLPEQKGFPEPNQIMFGAGTFQDPGIQDLGPVGLSPSHAYCIMCHKEGGDLSTAVRTLGHHNGNAQAVRTFSLVYT